MAKRQTLSLRFGVAGSGKTYSAVCDVVYEWAPYETGKLITNLPLFVDKIADFVKADVATIQRIKPEAARQAVVDRIHIIPHDEMARWSSGESGPWEYLHGADIRGCHLVIDEFHNFGGVAHDKDHIAKWMQFFGELRHRGATCEIMSQDIGKVADAVIKEAGYRVEITPLEEMPDPFFRIRLGDYFQVFARWMSRKNKPGEYLGGAFESQKRRDDRRWVKVKQQRWFYRNSRFALYDSFSKPHADQAATSGRPMMEWERLSRFGILKWFVRRNAVQAGLAVLFVCFLCFLSMGGLSWGMKEFLRTGMALAGGKKPTPAELVEGDDSAYKHEQDALHQQPMIRRINELERDNKALKDANSGLYHANLVNVNRLLWYTTLSAMQPDRVITRAGTVLKLNAVITDGGPYNGLRLTSIDWDNSLAQLSNGVVLRLPPNAKPPAEPEAANVGDSKGGGSTAGTAKNDSLPGSTDHSGSSRLDLTGPQPIPRRANQNDYHNLRAIGRQVGIDKGREPTSRNPTLGGGSSVGGSAFEGGPSSVFGGSPSRRSGNLVPQVDPRFGGRVPSGP